ncbi:MAG: O-antigen ligase family protein [Candidatus Sumerlaeota bacterium]
MKRFASVFSPEHPLAGAAWLLILCVLVGLPMLVVGAATDSFILPKQVILQCAVAMLCALAVAAALCGRAFKIYLQPANGFTVLFLAWSAISILWSQSHDLAVGDVFRFAALIGFSFIVQSFCATRKHLLLAVYALALSSFVVATMTIVTDFRRAFAPEGLHVRQVLGDWRDVISTVAFGNTSHLGDFLAFGFLVWLGILIVTRSRWLAIASLLSLILHAAGLIIAWSVHSNVSLIAGVSGLIFFLRDYGLFDIAKRVRKRVIALGVGFAMVIAFFVIDHPLNPHGSRIWKGDIATASGGIFSEAFGSPRWTSGLDTRYAIWLTTLEIIHNHPWSGTGAGNFVYTYPATISPIVESSPTLAQYGGSWTNAAHNEILQTWSDLGIGGLALFILMIGTAMKSYWDRLQDGTSFGNAVILAVGFSALIAMCVQMQMNFPLRLPVSSMLFFLLLAVPHLLPAGAQDEVQMLIPVERTWGPLTAEITMKNMSYPTTFSLVFSAPLVVRILASAIVIAGGIAACVQLSRPLRADIAYREVYEAQYNPSAISSSRAALLPKCVRILEIWPGHVDCRSRYQDMLLTEGKFQQVIEQTPLVLRKLNATEVYQRRALALMALGREKESWPDWDEIFRRRPGFGQAFPEQFIAWIERQKGNQDTASLANRPPQ